jgi:hypothetical protein
LWTVTRCVDARTLTWLQKWIFFPNFFEMNGLTKVMTVRMNVDACTMYLVEERECGAERREYAE